MGRFYKITVGGNNPQTFTNWVNGREDMKALAVEFNIPQAWCHVPASAATVMIWGVPLSMIAQASDFSYAPITIEGGMQAGLPLASEAVADNQQGILLQGMIFQSFGNWLGTNQNITFNIVPPESVIASQESPTNLTFVWKKGTLLSDAIRTTIKTAFGIEPDIKITDIVAKDDTPSIHLTMKDFSNTIYRQSIAAWDPDNTKNYPGVTMAIVGNTIKVMDGSQPPKAKAIKAQDLVGQVTWLGPATIQVNTVMRADFDVGSRLTLPESVRYQTQSSVQSNTQARNDLTFFGEFQVTQLIHMGSSRTPNAQSWMTAITATNPAAAMGPMVPVQQVVPGLTSAVAGQPQPQGFLNNGRLF